MRKRLLETAAILVIYLMIVLPVSYAVTISNDTVSPKNSYADFGWATDVASNSQLQWGTTPSYGQQSSSGNQVTVHALQATGLTPDTVYYYKIISSDGQFPAEKTGTFRTPDATPPPAPTQLQVIETTKTMITFSWDTSSAPDFSKFTLYRNGIKIYTGQQASFADINLSMGTSYTYAVSAWDLSGNEGPKATITASTNFPDITPPIITNITLAESLDTTAKISWITDDNSTSVVYYRTAAGKKQAKVDGYTRNHLVQISVEKGKTVFYLVSSCNIDSACSNSTETGFVGGRDITPPTITVYPIDNATGAFWYNADSIDLTGKTEGFSYLQIWSGGGYVGATTADENGTFRFTNVPLTTTSNLQTTLHVESTDPSGNKASKNYTVMLDFEAPVLNTTLPATYGKTSLNITGTVSEAVKLEVFVTTQAVMPTGMNYTVSNSGIQLTWDNINANRYYIYRDGTLIGTTDQPTFVDRQISKNNTYNYQVSSLNAACSESAKTASVSISVVNATQNATNPQLTLCQVTPKQSKQISQGSFSLTIDLTDGTQLVKVIAKDLAGNTAEVSQDILVSTTKPAFQNVHPSGSDWYYSGALDTVRVYGNTTPNSTVNIWVNRNPAGNADKTTFSDTGGSFEFEDVDFSSVSSLYGLFSASDSTPAGIPRWTNESTFAVDAQNLKGWLDLHRFYYLKATNSAGLESDFYPGKFDTKTCYSGNLSWSLMFKSDYQSPAFLSIERLQEGTERLAFYFEFTWIGSAGTDPQMVGKPLIKLASLDTSQMDEKAYNLTKLIISSMDFSDMMCDPTFTKCYVVAKMSEPITGLAANYSFDSWKSLFKSMGNQLKIPMQIEVRYKYKTKAGTLDEQTQKLCKEVSYSIDNTLLDTSKLPDWLVNDGLNFINKSIENINTILTKAKPIITTIGYVCVGSFLTYTALRIVRVVSEKIQMLSDKVDQARGESAGCYYDSDKKEKNTDTIYGYYKTDPKSGKTGVPADYISRLSNKNLKACYSKIYKVWTSEAAVYQAYKFSCNRIFCASSPTAWTGKKYLPGNEKTDDRLIRSYTDVAAYLQTLKNEKPDACKEGESLYGLQTRKTTCDFKEDKNIHNPGGFTTSAIAIKENYNGKDQCYLIDNAYWMRKDSGDNIELYAVYYPISSSGESTHSYSYDRALAAMKVNQNSDDSLYITLSGTCQYNCKKALGASKLSNVIEGSKDTSDQLKINTEVSGNYFWEITTIKECNDRIVTPNTGQKLGPTYGNDEGNEFNEKFKDQFESSDKANSETANTCCCYASSGSAQKNSNIVVPYDANYVDAQDEKNKGTDQKPVEWYYRYSQTKYIYPGGDNYEPQDSDSSDGTTLSNTEGLGNKFGDKKRDYDKRLYFSTRDNPAAFGQNYLWELTSSQPEVAKINPQSQFTGAVQTLCLTGIYKRLNMIKNVLTSIKSCIESAKYTGKYNSETCKELFSKYVCQIISDAIVSIGSGCSSTSGKNIEKDASPLTFLQTGFSGVTEAVGGAVSDFNQDYDNAAMKELFGTGVGSIAQKACMAALGYDWNLDINSVLDAAYSTEYNSNVIIPTLRRNYLFTNPTTQQPVFEYRGSVYITPGCTIDSYTVSLVCVNNAEKNKYKDIKCTTLDSCPCLSVGTVSPQTVVLTGGALTQGTPEDKAFHTVQDNSNYVYDHVKVELNMASDKKSKCLPDGYSDGVFYSPISDRTPVTQYGCTVSPSTGYVGCTSGLSAIMNFTNLIINDIYMNSDTVKIGESVPVSPIVTKTGSQKVCVWYSIYKGTPSQGQLKFGPKNKEITDTYSQAKVPNLFYLFDGTVPADLLGTGATIAGKRIWAPASSALSTDTQGATCNNIGLQTSDQPDSTSGTMTVYLVDKNNDGKITCGGEEDQYSLTSTTANLNKIPSNCVIIDGSKKVGINQVNLRTGGTSCNDINDVKIEFTIQNAGGTSSSQADMTLVVDGRIPSQSGSCTDGTAALAQAHFEKPFRVVREITDAQQPTCGQSTCTADQECKDSQCVAKTTNPNSQFGDIVVYGPEGNVITKTSRNGEQVYVFNEGDKYKISLPKPSNGFDGKFSLSTVPYPNKDLGSAVTFYQTSELFGSNSAIYYFDISSNWFHSAINTGRTYSMTMEAYRETVDGIQKVTSKTILVYVNPTNGGTSGVGLGGVCGPATGSSQTGICKLNCATMDGEIAPNQITDLTKKCNGGKCCTN